MIITVNLEMVGQGNSTLDFFLAGDSTSLAGGRKERRKSGVLCQIVGVVYFVSLGRPIDIGLQLGKAWYPCSR